jgi:hypothetical protein
MRDRFLGHAEAVPLNRAASQRAFVGSVRLSGTAQALARSLDPAVGSRAIEANRKASPLGSVLELRARSRIAI